MNKKTIIFIAVLLVSLVFIVALDEITSISDKNLKVKEETLVKPSSLVNEINKFGDNPEQYRGRNLDIIIEVPIDIYNEKGEVIGNIPAGTVIDGKAFE